MFLACSKNFVLLLIMFEVSRRDADAVACGNLSNFKNFTCVPTNVAVLSGTQVRLRCSQNMSTKLVWERSGSKISSGNTSVAQFAGKVDVDWSTGSFDLVISSAQPSDAGTYRCLATDEHAFSAELVILASHPVCTTNVSGSVVELDFVKLECHFTYRGNLDSLIACELLDADGTSMEIFSGTYVKQGSSDRFYVVVVLRISRTHNRFRCTTYFNYSANYLVNENSWATNYPDYRHEWNSSHVDVLYGVQYQVDNGSRIANPVLRDQTLSCVADGNPPPVYRWIHSTTGQPIHSGQLLDVCKVKGIETGDLQCLADNVILGKSYVVALNISANTTVRMLYIQRHCDNDDYTVLSGVLVVIVVVPVTAAVIAICRRRHTAAASFASHNVRHDRHFGTATVSTANTGGVTTYEELHLENRELASLPHVYENIIARTDLGHEAEKPSVTYVNVPIYSNLVG